MDDDPPIPDDHPIREIWETGRKAGTLAGLIELAESGDGEAARDLLRLFSFRQLTPDDLGRQRIHQKELLDYLAHCFNAILANREPADKALHLTTGKKSRSRLGHRTRFDRCLIGWEVADLMRREKLSLNEASGLISEKYPVSLETAKKEYQTYMVVRKKRRKK